MDNQTPQKRVKALLLLSLFTLLPSLKAIDPPTAENLKKLNAVLKAHPGDYVERTIKRLGNNTIGFESFISADADWSYLRKIIPDLNNYPNWIIKNINDRPHGGKYYVQIKSLRSDPKQFGFWDAEMFLKLPAVSMTIDRRFKVSTKEEKDLISFFIESLPHETSPVKSMYGYIQFFSLSKSANRVGIYANGNVVIRNWVLYEALPDRVVGREAGERVQIVLDNYMTEENRLRELEHKQ